MRNFSLRHLREKQDRGTRMQTKVVTCFGKRVQTTFFHCYDKKLMKNYNLNFFKKRLPKLPLILEILSAPLMVYKDIFPGNLKLSNLVWHENKSQWSSAISQNAAHFLPLFFAALVLRLHICLKIVKYIIKVTHFKTFTSPKLDLQFFSNHCCVSQDISTNK